MKRIRPLLVLTAVATAALFAPILSAHAETAAFGQHQGSSTDPRSTIVSTAATYSDGLAGVGLRTAENEDPATAADWQSGDLELIWTLHTSGADYDVFLLASQGGPEIAVTDSTAATIFCHGTPGYDPTSGYTAVFPASCIGHPAWFSVQGWIDYTPTSQYDFSPTYNTFGGLVHETITSTTTTTQPMTTTTSPGFTTAGAHDGYWMLSQGGDVWNFGTARSFRATNVAGAVHIESTPSGNGYWVLYAGGGVINRGDAPFLGQVVLGQGEKAVSLSATPSGSGYWIFTDKGRAIPFRDAQFLGDMSTAALNGPIVGSIATPTGKGYWMVGSDGGIFSFGDARFHGSTGNIKLNKPVMAMAPAADGSGYWLVASDGGVFAFDVSFYGSMGGTTLNRPISGMVAQPGGYMMVSQDGGIFAFGQTAFHGSLGANPPASPIVSAALQP
jgi:hypothetical protein